MTEEKEKYDRAVSDFTTSMYQKGYRGKYTLSYSGSGQQPVTGSLRQCLERFLEVYGAQQKSRPHFQLTTHPAYNDKFNCLFKINFDEVKGFLVREMTVTDSLTNQNRQYRLDRNHQIPGSVAVLGLFPKPKPWDNHLKGRFRP